MATEKETEKEQPEVTIGSLTIKANSTSRATEAVNAIAQAKAEIEGQGYVLDTKGPSAGESGRFKVYAYEADAGHKIGDRNNGADAAHVFSVKYESGGYPVSQTALAESLANGLGEVAQQVKIERIANGNEQAFQVHEQLKSGDLALEDMTAKQMELMKDINFQTKVTEGYDGGSLSEAFEHYSPSDSAWVSSMNRTATVEMESAGGLKMAFDVQTEPSNGYGSVETLRDLYDCNVGFGDSSEASIGGKPVNPSDMSQLADVLRDQWESQALQEVGQLPMEYEPIADRTFSDMAIDQTLDVGRNATGELVVSFSVNDPYQNASANFTVENGNLEPLGEDMSEAAVSIAQTYVADNQQKISEEIDSFKLKEVGLSNVEVDSADGDYFVTFQNQGENGYVGLDSETLKLDSTSPGYDKLNEAQVEVLSEHVGKATADMNPPLGLYMAKMKASELGALTDKEIRVSLEGGKIVTYEGMPGDPYPKKASGSYKGLTELNRALDEKIGQVRDRISDENKMPMEPERKAIRI
ncbi:hypothetical protein F3I62_18875 [Pseudomonas sp. R-28-1W-6]|uniref:hypothetical protein n=1 Tax=Pseudomonas sp. R-28-1W-6 TaxID=2650101 RepID=UPI0013665CB7|nr:hypothetical protein [Pseudomonas sp. R-28-1W-6]MWV14169.1 hypothetical protein [Pseudomonas sp. R-28-1W-6]